MAQPQKKPFNLLYKIEAQMSFVDKLYEFVVGPARIVVVGVMLVIIIAFIVRFPLDATLNDKVKESKRNETNLRNALNKQEAIFRATFRRIDAVKKYETTYKNPSDPSSGNSYELSFIMSKVLDAKEPFGQDILISDYGLTTDTDQTIVKVNGGATTFEKLDEFVKALRAIDIVSDASSTSQSGQRGQIPRFSIDIKIKK